MSSVKTNMTEAGKTGAEPGKISNEIGFKDSVSDIRVRLIMIPLLGLVIPNLVQIFAVIEPFSAKYWLSYLWFILLSLLLWNANRYFLFKQRMHLDWFNQPFRKTGTLLFACIFISLPLTIFFIASWYKLMGLETIDWAKVQLVSLINVIAVIFITHIYETVFLIREREDDLTKVMALESARNKAELQALKNQIDPHFVFNSLNTLSYLMEHKPEVAKKFNQNLSDVYRYLIQNRKRDFVPLEDEMAFTNKYIQLLELRYEKALRINVDIDCGLPFLIIPVSVQGLIENAVKHNEVSLKNPLEVWIKIKGSSILVGNVIRSRISSEGKKSGTGLENLNQRSVLLTDRSLIIHKENSSFVVEVPLIAIHAIS